ncbi:autotransporter outer membrane beta-barrel domain-containing protein [Yersinia frederiksenii]|uniref:autotransporter outer membrane beta-barrel domain-containing protein n=1 Tax=Yersinia frederiksenii TaxID=29484 RepID=UPI0005E58A1A|nr:autotransporter outer membrane beta-barrel domain-containing protein [Yersinia frederiksenii]CFR27289.1 autotransporter protein [Yersinia frederiksenii]
MNVKKTSTAIAVLASLVSQATVAANFTNTVNTDTTTLLSGDTVNTTDAEGVQVFNPLRPLDIGDTGSISISVDSAFMDSRGISASNGTNLNLGTGTSINLNSSSSVTGASGIGVNIGGDSSIKANTTDISISAVNTAIGINSYAGRSSIDLGSNSVIRANSLAGNASAIYLAEDTALQGNLRADQLHLEASGNVATGLSVNGYHNVNIGSGSIISVAGKNLSSGIILSGIKEGSITADTVTIRANGNNTVGVRLNNESATSIVDLGRNSVITTNGTDSSGIYSSVINSASFNAESISVHTVGSGSHAIESHSGSTTINAGSQLISDAGIGVYASSQGSVSAPQVTVNDSIIYGKEAGVYADSSSTLINLNNTSISSDNTTIIASNGGAVQFNGNGNISSSSGKAIEANNGRVNIYGKSNILGDVSSENNGFVDLILDNSLISGDLIADSTSNISLSLENDSQWSGYSQNAAKIALDSSSSWILTGNSDVNSLVNAGVISLNGAPGTVLTVTGDYIGNNGLLNFNTVLNDDTSATDKLVVNGNTSGTSFVSVNNVGGIGMATLNGIELIQVNGMSDGDFVKNGRIVAGAYEYSLVRGTGVNTNNWYLTNELVSNPAPDLPPSVPVQRPEAGAYTANLAAANNMFVTRLHDRLGETQYIDALTGEQKVTSMWLRNEGGHNRSRDINGQLNTQANRYVVQLGGDIAQWSNNGMDRFHLGVMAGYGNSKSTTVSQETGYNAKGSIDGYSTGVYGTWYANEVDKSGLYVDGWMQYSWFNNTVDGQALATEEYKSKGISTSIESGYTFKMGENVAKNATYFIQPKAQVTWMGVKSDDHKEANGTIVSGEGDGNIQTRLGVKAFMNGYSDQDKGKERVFQPFVEANWVHNTKDIGTTLNNVTVSQDGAANIGELKVGVEGQINRKVNLWGNVGQQIGNKGYSDTAVMLGVKYNF